MLKIGDFSKLTRISVRMLRHYDENKLLIPVETDKFTGYRYYSREQLATAAKITDWRDMGFGVAEIRELLSREDDAAYVRSAVQRRRREILDKSVELTRQLGLLEAWEHCGSLTPKKGETTMNPYEVSLKQLPERYVASVRMIIPNYECEGTVWSILVSETAGMKLVEDTPCYCCVFFHDREFKETNVDVEAQKMVKGHYADTEHVRFRNVPAVTYASAVLHGSYRELPKVNEAVVEWIERNGYRMDGAAFNIYHVSPHETSNPNEFVTEVCYPVTR